MPDQLLSDRVERLEKTVQRLETVPAEVAALGERVGSVETQILQLRTEMRVESSAVRGEVHSGNASVKSELRQEIAALREETHQGFAGARDDLLLGLATLTRDLGQQIRDTAEEGRRHSRVLFEEVLGRIAALGEHREEDPRRKPRAPRRKT